MLNEITINLTWCLDTEDTQRLIIRIDLISSELITRNNCLVYDAALLHSYRTVNLLRF